MDTPRTYSCAICGELNPNPAHWFLVAENAGEEKLQILEWNRQLAKHCGVHLACSPSHVQELVVHWMATGSVHHPFATGAHLDPDTSPTMRSSLKTSAINTRGVRTISEITLNRDSVRRVLTESPGSFRSMLRALNTALQQQGPAIHNVRKEFLPGTTH